MRIFYMAAGIFFVGLGIAGAFLPLLPTVVFFLIAAILFARSNPAWEKRIMTHPKWGPPIRDFRERGVISRRAKISAVTAMAISSAISAVLLRGWVAWTPAAVCLICAAWIVTRPSQ